MIFLKEAFTILGLNIFYILFQIQKKKNKEKKAIP